MRYFITYHFKRTAGSFPIPNIFPSVNYGSYSPMEGIGNAVIDIHPLEWLKRENEPYNTNVNKLPQVLIKEYTLLFWKEIPNEMEE